jgi:hypothetical protein
VTIVIRDGTNTPRTITDIQVRDGTNTPRTITEIRVRDSNNVSRIVFSTGSPLEATASPENVFGFDIGTGTATTDLTTVTPTGGVAPYTYAWAVTTYSGGVAPEADSPTLANTTFTQTGLSSGEYTNATFVCTVTDDDGATTEVPVGASFYSEGIIP